MTFARLLRDVEQSYFQVDDTCLDVSSTGCEFPFLRLADDVGERCDTFDEELVAPSEFGCASMQTDHLNPKHAAVRNVRLGGHSGYSMVRTAGTHPGRTARSFPAMG